MYKDFSDFIFKICLKSSHACLEMCNGQNIFGPIDFQEERRELNGIFYVVPLIIHRHSIAAIRLEGMNK